MRNGLYKLFVATFAVAAISGILLMLFANNYFSDTVWRFTFMSVQATLFSLAAVLSAELLRESLYIRLFGWAVVIFALFGWFGSIVFGFLQVYRWYELMPYVFIISAFGAQTGLLYTFADQKRNQLMKTVGHLSGLVLFLLSFAFFWIVNSPELYYRIEFPYQLIGVATIVTFVSTTLVVLQSFLKGSNRG